MAAVFDKLRDNIVKQIGKQEEQYIYWLFHAEAVENDTSCKYDKILIFYPRGGVRFPEVEKYSQHKESYLP